MVLRKHIALEDEHVRKIQPLIDKHNGNLSAAIRDTIDLTTIALQFYDNVDDAKSLITTIKEIQEDQVILPAPLFHWLLKKSKGLIIDKQTLDYVIDPISITSIPELEDYINNMCRDLGWHVETMIDCDHDMLPTFATMTLTGNYTERVYFLAIILGKYLAVYKNMGIVSVHPQLGELEIELKQKKSNTEAIQDLVNNLGYMVNIAKELDAHPNFWKRLISEHSATNYNLVSFHRNFYEDLMSGKIPKTILSIESEKTVAPEEMSLSQFLHILKVTGETSRMVNRIYIEGDNLKIQHGFRNMKAVANVRDVFISILEGTSFNYDSEITNTYIYLRRHPEIEEKTRELFEKLQGNGKPAEIQKTISSFVHFIEPIENIDYLLQLQMFGKKLGKHIMMKHEEKYATNYWDTSTFAKVFGAVDGQIKSEWDIRPNSMRYTVHECIYADDPKKCNMHRAILKGALEYVYGSSAEHETLKLLSLGDDCCEAYVHVS